MKMSRRQSWKPIAAAAALPSIGAAAPGNPPPIRLVVLDVGGTIIEDRGDVPTAVKTALAHHGVSSTPEEIAKWRGAAKRDMLRHFVDLSAPGPSVDRDKLTSAIYDEFTANLIEIYRSVPPIAGAEDAIREMREKKYLVATTTGFDRAINTSIFRRLGWEKYFAASISSDDVAQGRPAPFMLFHAMEAARVGNVAEVVAVGDTPLDLQAGSNAGMRGVIGVLTGAGTPESLAREPHTHIVASVAKVPELLGKL
jgi:phosphonatase-like hydrolase